MTTNFNSTCESTSAVNMETTMDMSSVYAKPFTEPVPKNASTAAAIIVVMLESIIAVVAL